MQHTALLPSRALGTVERGFGRMLEDWFEGFGPNPASARRFGAALDLVETPLAWRLTVDLPGVAEDDIHLAIEDDVLELRAERQEPDRAEGEHVRHVERTHGTWARRLRLTGAIDGEGIEARLADGVLVVTLPKAQETRPQRIQVQRG